MSLRFRAIKKTKDLLVSRFYLEKELVILLVICC
nr:MAG TPA: hypothetical protein [Bacteriophage sp.]